ASVRSYAVPPRALVLVGGFRACRVVGGGPVLRVPFDLPALARPGVASAGRWSADGDLECFLTATALPLQAATPSSDAVLAAAAAVHPLPPRRERLDPQRPAGGPGRDPRRRARRPRRRRAPRRRTPARLRHRPLRRPCPRGAADDRRRPLVPHRAVRPHHLTV